MAADHPEKVKNMTPLRSETMLVKVCLPEQNPNRRDPNNTPMAATTRGDPYSKLKALAAKFEPP